jgi:hypothetical protein
LRAFKCITLSTTDTKERAVSLQLDITKHLVNHGNVVTICVANEPLNLGIEFRYDPAKSLAEQIAARMLQIKTLVIFHTVDTYCGLDTAEDSYGGLQGIFELVC